MFALKINTKKPSPGGIRMIADAFKRGETVLYPTDTIYGLGCLATDRKAIKNIFKLKKKDPKTPMLVLVDSLAMAKRYVCINANQVKLLKAIWPGPVSVILESTGKLPKELSGKGKKNSLGIRLPKSIFLIKLIKEIGFPIVSTSANISGKSTILSIKETDKHFKTVWPDLAVDGGILKGKASSLVDLRDEENIKILRK